MEILRLHPIFCELDYLGLRTQESLLSQMSRHSDTKYHLQPFFFFLSFILIVLSYLYWLILKYLDMNLSQTCFIISPSEDSPSRSLASSIQDST